MKSESSAAPQRRISRLWQALKSGIEVWVPPPDRTADEWADANRVLPKGSAEPGPFRSSRTPFMIPIMEAAANPRYKAIVVVAGAQSGKTDGLLNIVGQRLDDDPTPIIYVGPSRSFVESQAEPRLMQMLRSAEKLWRKVSHGKKTKKTVKYVNGVPVRLAWAGSATELSSQPAGLGLIDERDRMMDNVKGEGDPVALVEARGTTYTDFKMVVTSTPTVGNVETEVDEKSGIAHWRVADTEQIESPTWRFWQEGTRFEWSWPCPKCKKYFVPRLALLWWPENSTPYEVVKTARVKCPHCEHKIDDRQRQRMNEHGVYTAPGVSVNARGQATGSPPDSETASFWFSGLCSPWRSFGQRARQYLEAVRSGDPERVQAVINTAFGELYAVAKEQRSWEEVAALRQPYSLGAVPEWVQFLTLGADVQKDRIFYSVRGWAGASSALIDRGELLGNTEYDDVWETLAEFRERGYGNGKRIMRAMVDSGFRSQNVYSFCRKTNGWALATKGQESQDKPIKVARVDINYRGKVKEEGLQLWHIHTDYFKSWVYSRYEWKPGTPGHWLLPQDVDEDYCRQLVAEARVVKPSGKTTWVRLRKANHYFDCEVLNAAAAHSLLGSLSAVATGAIHQQAASGGKKTGRRVISKGVQP